MAEGNWTRAELEAAVEAYLQMLDMEQAGKPFNKAAVSRALLAGPLKGRTSTDHRMQNISSVLQGMARPWVAGFKPLPNVGSGMSAMITQIIAKLEAPDATPRPLLPPVEVPEGRKLPPTGYWIFICRRERWDGEAWLRLGRTELLYKVSEHNRNEVQVGDVGLLRLNKRDGTRDRLPQPAGVYAIVEVIESPTFQPDPAGHYVDPASGETPEWRARLRILANLVDTPVDAALLPVLPAFEYLRHPLQTSSIPLQRDAFSAIVALSPVDRTALGLVRHASTPEGIRKLEQLAKNLDPARKERISRYIERGPIGDRVKAARKHHCQLCEALGLDAVAFLKSNGKPYAEAHHVEPVSLLLPGSLGEQNIMVLCPNHHRQVHHGNFAVIEHRAKDWRVELDGKPFTLARTALS